MNLLSEDVPGFLLRTHHECYFAVKNCISKNFRLDFQKISKPCTLFSVYFFYTVVNNSNLRKFTSFVQFIMVLQIRPAPAMVLALLPLHRDRFRVSIDVSLFFDTKRRRSKQWQPERIVIWKNLFGFLFRNLQRKWTKWWLVTVVRPPLLFLWSNRSKCQAQLKRLVRWNQSMPLFLFFFRVRRTMDAVSWSIQVVWLIQESTSRIQKW